MRVPEHRGGLTLCVCESGVQIHSTLWISFICAMPNQKDETFVFIHECCSLCAVLPQAVHALTDTDTATYCFFELY